MWYLSTVRVDPHRVAEERSVAYHRAIAERLRQDLGLLDVARRRVRQWMSAPEVPRYAREWARVLAGDTDSITAFLVERSERANELRQSSPFAGVLSPRRRWQIWRESRGRMAERP
jgi:predicted unusual protein kinase regulating ubiquinone biosynthesis (AarF/ABC1/UbiB family)